MRLLQLFTGLLLLSLVSSESQGGCVFRSPLGYTLKWIVDEPSQQVYFNLTYYNFPTGSYTGVGFGDNMASGLDVILVSLPQGGGTPQITSAAVNGYAPPTRNTNSEVQGRSVTYQGSTLTAEFTRPLNGDSSNSRSLSGCVMWNFISSPGVAYTNGTFGKHKATPDQEQECDIATRCKGTIPAVYIDTPNNGAWSSNSNQQSTQQPQNFNNQPTSTQSPQYSNSQFNNQQQQFQNQQQFNPNQPYYNQNQNRNQNNQYNQQFNPQPQFNPNSGPQYPPFQTQRNNFQPQFNQNPFGPSQPNMYQSQNQNQNPYGPNEPNMYQNANQMNQNPPQMYQNQPYQSVGNGVSPNAQQNPSSFYNPYNDERIQKTGMLSNYNGQQNNGQQQQQQTYGRKKRQANSNIYGYNTDSNASPSGINLVQNPNYMFLPNNIADQYARTYDQIQSSGGYSGSSGVQRDANGNIIGGSTTPKPVLTNSAQNQQNYQQIQRDSSLGLYSTVAPATNIYGYNYNTPSNTGFLSSSSGPTPSPSLSSSSSVNSRQFDPSSSSPSSSNDIARQRFYNPGVSSVGNVFTGSLYSPTPSGGSTSSFSSSSSNNYYDPSTVGYNTGTTAYNNGRQFDSTVNTNTQGGYIAGANRGMQPGQIVFYDGGRKKRSIRTRSKRQARFFDPGNNQTAMYYPYRTSTDFNLNNGQQGYSQTSYQRDSVNGGVGGQRYYDASRGVYVDQPQFDSRGGNQYLKTAPVNPQSPNFVQTLNNNAQALNDYTDSSCSRQDPYWCASYVQQIVQAQGSFNSYSGGICNTLVASLQYADNRCCNAVRSAGCQI